MRWAVVERLLAGVSPATILEVGCGQGAFGSRLAARGRYLGVEPDATSFAVAKSRIAGVGASVQNITEDGLPPDARFDLVCAFEVLEHLEDDETALAAWSRRLAPGGRLMISMPAWQSRFNEWDTLVGHYRRYSPEQVDALLRAAGLIDVQVVVYGWPLGYALEGVRSRIARRRGVGGEDVAVSMEHRTAGSGRILQPRALAGKLMQLGVLPFVALQNFRPAAGTGLVAVARQPS